MKKKSRAILIFAAALIASLALWAAFRPREPVYQGKPVSFWFKKYVFSFSPAREEALETIAEIGPDAVPYLARMLRKNDSALARAYRSLRPKLPTSAQRWLPQPIEPKRLRADAARCLGRVGLSFTTPVGPLLKAAQYPDPEMRTEALDALLQIGPRTDEIVAAFASALEDRHTTVRDAALLGLWGVSNTLADKSGLKLAIPALVAALKDPIWQNRMLAVRTLMNLGAEAKAAVPSLLEIFKNSAADSRLACEAANALMAIKPTLAESVIPLVIRELEAGARDKKTVKDVTFICPVLIRP